jgi:glycosyltransferase involved in cell wall biosynthesis
MNNVVTVFTITYNCERFIKNCYDSIKNQTLSDWKWLIVDDGSEDKTEIIINEINDSRINYYKLPKNVGRGKARNFGLTKIDSLYTVILDMDDTMSIFRLENSIKIIKKYNVDLVFTSLNITNANKEVISSRKALYSNFPKLYTHATLCISSELLKELKYCNSRYAEDFVLVLKTLEYNYKIINEPLYNYFESGSINLKGAYLSNLHLLNNLKSYYSISQTKVDIVYLLFKTFIKKYLLLFMLNLKLGPLFYHLLIRLRKN